MPHRKQHQRSGPGCGHQPPVWADRLDYAELLLTRVSSRGTYDICRVVVDGNSHLLAIPRLRARMERRSYY
jgi:hypothetical protein